MKGKRAVFILLWILVFAGCDAAAPLRTQQAPHLEESCSEEEREAPDASVPVETTATLLRETDYAGCLPESVSLRFTSVEADAESAYFRYGCVWTGDDVLIGLHSRKDGVTIIRYEDGPQSAAEYHLDLVLGQIMDLRTVEEGVLVNAETGCYLIDANGELQKALVYAEYEIDPEKSYSHNIAISDDFSTLAYFEYEPDVYEEDQVAAPGWHRFALLDIETGAATVLMEEEFPADGEFFPIAPVFFSDTGDFLFYEYLIFRGHDGGFFGGRIDLRTGAREDLAAAEGSPGGWIVSASGNDRVLLQTSYDGILSLTIHNLDSGEFSVLPIGDDPIEERTLSQAGEPWYYVTDSWGEFRLYDLNEERYITLFQLQDEPLPDFKLRAVSPDGSKVAGFSCDEDGSYLITVLELLQGLSS